MKIRLALTELLTLVLVFLHVPVFAQVLEFEENALLEVSTRSLGNTDLAKDAGEDWDSEQLTTLYSNIDFNLRLFDHKFSASWFFRYAHSPLFENEALALNNALFPQKIIARDLFKTHYTKTDDGSQIESVINRFTYEFGDDDFYFRLGRMYINYGEGYMANVINPFNLPGFKGTHDKFNQGNDGIEVKIEKDKELTLKIYLLSDRSYYDYSGERTSRTFLLQGTWQYKPDTEILYILGEDQKRHKYGLQIKKSLEKLVGYFQAVRFSQKLDKEGAAAKGLNHYLAGAKYQTLRNLNTRVEIGKQEYSKTLDEANQITAHYIPLRNIIALINEYQHTDSQKYSLALAQDSYTDFSFGKLEYVYQAKSAYQVYAHALAVLNEAKAKEIGMVQQTLAREIALGFRYFY